MYSSLYINVTSIYSFVKIWWGEASETVFIPGLSKGQWKQIQSWIVNRSVNCMKQLLRLTMCLSACLHGDWEGGFAETSDAVILCLLFSAVWWDTQRNTWWCLNSVEQDIHVWDMGCFCFPPLLFRPTIIAQNPRQLLVVRIFNVVCSGRGNLTTILSS